MENEITVLALNAIDPEGRFTGLPLSVSCYYYGGKQWELQKEFSYRTDEGGTATVRAGFEFDFASVPRPLWWLYPPTGLQDNPYGIAALVHDWLCAHRKIEGEPIGFSRANDVFLEIMLYLKIRKTIAYPMYWAVQSPWGWWLWQHRKPEDIIP
jgi:hypothetical protein